MRRFILAVLLFVAAVPMTANAQDEPNVEGNGPLRFYESPTFGYVVRWDENDADWKVESSAVGPSDEVLVFRREDDSVIFHGYEGYEGNPEACRRQLVDQLYETSTAGLQIGIDTDGRRMEGGDKFRAWAAYVTARYVDEEGEHPESVWHLECRRLIPGSAVLTISYVVPLDRYDAFVDAAYDLIDLVVMPRLSYDLEVVDGQPTLLGPVLKPGGTWLFPRPPEPLFDRSDNEAGMTTLVAKYDPDEVGAWDLYVAFENTGTVSLRIDPLAVQGNGISQTGENEFEEYPLQPVGHQWETGDGDFSDEERNIGPGNA